MVSKTEMLQMLNFAMDYEERFVPELHILLEQRIMEYRLTPAKEAEAKRLLMILVKESTNHFKLLQDAFLEVDKGDKNAY